MTRLVFWGSVAGLVYSYVVFPVVVLLRGRFSPKPYRSADITPSLTVVVAAHNEAGRIGPKLKSISEQEYPQERITVVVASDGSDDGTPAVIAALRMPNVRVLDLPRVGKADALRAAVGTADSDILVFSDANSVFARDALRQLVRPFDDPGVGGVAGNQVYVQGTGQDAIVVGEQSYWNFDRTMKTAQSRAGHVIQTTGALYAIRRPLFRPIPAGVNDDFYLSLAVIDSGYRLVFEPAAVAYESVAPSRTLEYGRRVRIMTRGLRCVAAIPRVLDPRRTGFYSLQVFSHKVLMRVMALPLAAAAVASVLLFPQAAVYRLAAGVQLAFYALGAAGLALARSPIGERRLLALPAYFCMIQMASLHATWNLLTGRTYERWDPAGETGDAGRDTADAPADMTAPAPESDPG
jgi:GT2 family glycosyltransferase